MNSIPSYLLKATGVGICLGTAAFAHEMSNTRPAEEGESLRLAEKVVSYIKTVAPFAIASALFAACSVHFGVFTAIGTTVGVALALDKIYCNRLFDDKLNMQKVSAVATPVLLGIAVGYIAEVAFRVLPIKIIL